MDMMWYRRRGLMVTPHIESVTGAIASFNSDYNKIPIKSLICDIEPIQEGTGDPSPENVRPISGRSGVSVVRSGKNLIGWVPGTQITSAGVQYTINADGSISCVGTATETTWGPGNSEQVLLKAGTYMATIRGNTNIRFNVVNDSVTPSTVIGTTNGVFTLAQDTLVHVYITGSNGVTFNETVYVQLELGSTATEYEPYKGNTYTVNWETEAGTVYGGYVDVVSGKLVVDRAMVVIDGVNKRVQENGITSTTSNAAFGGAVGKAYGRSNFISDRFATKNVIVPGNMEGRDNSINIEFMLPADIPNNTPSLNRWFVDNPTQLVYELATPIEIQLTPQEVKTLLVNNIWCDSGNVSVDYWKWGK